MFRHLKPADFMTAIEGLAVTAKRQAHLAGCKRCQATFEEMNAAYQSVSAAGDDQPEVDWELFRSSVRDRLLARAVQRETRESKWMLWPSHPALSWSLSLLAAVGLTFSSLVWYYEMSGPDEMTVRAPVVAPANASLPASPQMANGRVAEAVLVLSNMPLVEAEMMVWSTGSVFEEIGGLSEAEANQLRKLLNEVQEEK